MRHLTRLAAGLADLGALALGAIVALGAMGALTYGVVLVVDAVGHQIVTPRLARTKLTGAQARTQALRTARRVYAMWDAADPAMCTLFTGQARGSLAGCRRAVARMDPLPPWQARRMQTRLRSRGVLLRIYRDRRGYAVAARLRVGPRGPGLGLVRRRDGSWRVSDVLDPPRRP